MSNNHKIYKQKTKAKTVREYNFQIIVIESVDILTDTRGKCLLENIKYRNRKKQKQKTVWLEISKRGSSNDQ